MSSPEPAVRAPKSTEALDLPPDIERIVGGRYELVDKLGEGGFAIVYKARHTELRDLFYAIKILRGEHAGQAEVIKKFRHEAVLLSGLKCPQTVRVMDFGVTGGSPYFVMEFVTGVSLESLLTRYGKLPPAMVARLSMDILESLAEAHTARIVHRDIKPANVLVIEGFGGGPARAKVLDFGIAKVLANEDDAAALANQTVGDFIFCTPLYAPPEVLRRQAQPQSDLYSLGHMMAEALDGRAPYASDVPVMSAHQHLQGGVIPLGPDTELSPLAAIIRRAAAAKIEDRYPTAAAMLADIRRVLPQLADDAEPALFVSRLPVATDALLTNSDTMAQESGATKPSQPAPSQPIASAADSATRLGWEQPASSTPVGAARPRGPSSTPAIVADPTRTPVRAATVDFATAEADDDASFAPPRSTGRNVAIGATVGVALAALVGWFALSGNEPAPVAAPAASAAGSAEAPAPAPTPVPAAAPPAEPKSEGSAQPVPAPVAVPVVDTKPAPEPVRTTRTKKTPVATKPAPAATPAPAPTPVAAPAPPPVKAPEPPPAEPKRPVLKERKPLFVPD
jgi:serine/threonine-protein kinase